MEEAAATGPRRTATLVRQLCASLAPTSSPGVASRLFKYSLRILGSHISPSVAEDEQYMVSLVTKKLARDGMTIDAARFTELYTKLCDAGVVHNRWAILLFLYIASQNQQAHERDFLKVLQTESAVGSDHELLPRIDHTTAEPAQGRPPLVATLAGRPADGAPPQLPTAGAAPSKARQALLARYRQQVWPGDETSESLERLLIQDLIFVFQGINGRHVTYNSIHEAFLVDQALPVPRSVRDLVSKLAELGWLYQRVRRYIAIRIDDAALGLVGQAFCSILQQELTEYYRLVAVLEGQVQTSGGEPLLTLRRLVVWTYDPLQRMRILASMVDHCAGMKGGQLASAIFSFSEHGDHYIVALVRHLMGRVAKPIYSILHRWIYEGELEDPYSEFFVASDPTAGEEEMWEKKYSIRQAMLPAFIPHDLCERILLIGKSINFIRKRCNDHGSIMDEATIRRPLAVDASDVFGGSDGLRVIVNKAFSVTNARLLAILHDEYKLMHHLRAMRRFLLLGQGDFIGQLMDHLQPTLIKPASSLLLHNLTGILESAIRSSNAQFEDMDVLGRLDVRLLEASPGDSGWDVFSLMYRVDGPISTVFHPTGMHQYLTVFNFLWRAKRMEYILSHGWLEQTSNARMLKAIPEMSGLLHKSYLLLAEMMHFVDQIQHYVVFEVIECSWDELVTDVQRARTLDDVIRAHDKFLRSIMERALLSPPSQQMLSQLRSIFDCIQRFRQTQDLIFGDGTKELARRRRFTAGVTSRATRGDWGMTEEDSAEQERLNALFADRIVPQLAAKLKVVAESYKDMVSTFLVMLTKHPDVELKHLSFRIDFNEHYRRSSARYSMACSPFHKTRPAASRRVREGGPAPRYLQPT